MRKVYLDSSEGNHISKISFYSPSQGYVAFNDWIGYTTDTGRTFTKKYITQQNVDYNGYLVNYLVGFDINGVKAFNQSIVIVYGDYGLVPAILYSTDGGDNFRVVFHSLYGSLDLRGGISDMIFPQNNSTGYATDADRILKTVDGGLSWSISAIYQDAYFEYLEAPDNFNIFALSTVNQTNLLVKTNNGGATWSTVNMPSAGTQKMIYAHFLNSLTGWISMADNVDGYIYKTTDGGVTWILLNNAEATSFGGKRIKFFDNSIGYAIGGELLNTISKTTDGGITWEPLQRDNNYSYLGYVHNDLYFLNNSQFWAGGGHGFLELTTNGGGIPLPKAYFRIDTTGLYLTNTVNLLNFSKTGYSYQWFLNSNTLSTSYNASYTHDVFKLGDTIKLVVSNGSKNDTLTRYIYFTPPIIVRSFSPTIAGAGAAILIKGQNFTGANSVSFGGTPAASFTVQNDTTISASLGSGTSGAVKVTRPNGIGSLAGFTFISPPTISSFNPTAAVAGSVITITGTNFTSSGTVKIGGIQVSFIAVNPTTISAIVPSGPSGNIQITTPGGTASIPGFAALPKINSFLPASGPIGTVMNITGTSFTGATAITVGGTPVASFTVNSSTSITAVINNGSSGDVVVTVPGGSSSLSGFTWFATPVINSFSPVSATAGATITITGTGFSPLVPGNIVMFGSVRAAILTATNTVLTVTVPPGALYQPISVTCNNLIAYSPKPFVLTFPNGGSITANSLINSTPVPFSAGTFSSDVLISDFNNDLKNDIAVFHSSNPDTMTGVSVLKNNSTGPAINFLPQLYLKGYDVAGESADLDGDGMLDIVITSKHSNSDSIYLTVYRNISTTSSNIQFDTAVKIAMRTPYIESLCLADIDADGKTDIIASSSWNGIYMLKNIGWQGNINFKQPVSIYGQGSRNMIAMDLNGDQKPEIISAAGVILQNNCTPLSISFTRVNIPLGLGYITYGDFDNDGRIDLVQVTDLSSNLLVFRNTSMGGAITFNDPLYFSCPSRGYSPEVADIDGDGMVDIIASLTYQRLCILKNIASSDGISFAPAIGYINTPSLENGRIAIGDINNDNRNDILVSSGKNNLSVFLNNVKKEPFIKSFSPTLGSTGTVVTFSGINFTGTNAVFFGNTPAASFSVISDTVLTAIVGAGATGNVMVTNTAGSFVFNPFIYGIPPSVTSFAPVSAAPGSSIMITGSNFSTTPQNNIVYFGDIKARVDNATATTLSVTVPYGSQYEPISVTTGGLTSFSVLPFTTLIPGTNILSSSSFAPRMDIYEGVGANCDIDGDGKLDFLNVFPTYITVKRNTSTSGNISFGTKTNVNFTGSISSGTTGDVDGDGKEDVILISQDSLKLFMLRNTSNPGVVSFEPLRYLYTFLNTPNAFIAAVADMDMDGRNDLVFCSYSYRGFYILRNTSTPGNISFGERKDYIASGYATGLKVFDIDGDKKPEVICTSNGSISFDIFNNQSVPGNISFGPKTSIGSVYGVIEKADIDSDGKMDILFSRSGTISVYRNTSSISNISFAPKVNFSSVTNAGISVNDFDGDSKPDVLFTQTSSSKISILKNTSVPGTVSLSSTDISFSVQANTYNSFSADLDNDGRADIFSGTIVYRNQLGGVGPTLLSFTPVSALQGIPVTLQGIGFNSVSEVNFGNTPADSFIINSDNVITAYPGNGATGSVVIKTPTGNASLAGFTYSLKPVITGINPAIVKVGTSVKISGANFSGISSVSFGNATADSFQIISPVEIIAWPSANSQSGTVMVRSATDTALIAGFKYYNKPIITSFALGVSVTIAGHDFIDVSSVSFGDVPAESFNVISPDTIKAVVSNSNGASGNITVTTPGGTAAYGGYLHTGVPWIESFYPLKAPPGGIVTIKGRNFNGASAVKFGGTAAASFTVNSSTSITAVVDTGSSGKIFVTMGSVTNPSDSSFTILSANTPYIVYFAPVVAAPGMRVTINGFNFANVSSVKFGGVAASSFTVVSPTLITAIVPAGTASGNVSITTVNGTATQGGFIFSTVIPFITSFSPAFGNKGTTVTIKGANFNSTPSQNTVYFGSIKASVQVATTTSLTVQVPAGTVYTKISVTSNGLTGYSAQYFTSTFAATGSLTPISFAVRTDSVSDYGPGGVSLGDIDVDGKLDIVTCNSGLGAQNRRISIFRNLSSGGKLSLASRYNYLPITTPGKCYFTDFDGDGKQDIATSNGNDVNAVAVNKNSSTPGNLSIATTPVIVTASLGPFANANTDYDYDGKPDILVGGYYNATIFRNTTTAGNISFAPRVDFGNAGGILISEDFDLDGMTDILMPKDNTDIYRNTSSPGTISFTACADMFKSYYPCATADFDKDGKADVITYLSATGAYRIAVFRNTSSPGLVSFEKVWEQTLPSSYAPLITINDIDGNSSVDIIVSHQNANMISVYANANANGGFIFSDRMDYGTNGNATDIVSGDVDEDSRPDIILTNYNSNTVSVIKNLIAVAPTALQVCKGGNTIITSNITGASYQWEVNTGNGFSNISNNGNYSGATTSFLQLNNLPSAWYGYVYRCRVGNKTSSEFSLKFVNTWTGTINSSWENTGNWSCNILPDGNTDVVLNSGTIVLNSTGFCRSIAINAAASFNITAGNRLTITH